MPVWPPEYEPLCSQCPLTGWILTRTRSGDNSSLLLSGLDNAFRFVCILIVCMTFIHLVVVLFLEFNITLLTSIKS